MTSYTIKNKYLSVSINSFGAELSSIINNNNGVEYLWCGDEKYWKRQSPVLFPFVGMTKNAEFIVEDNTYKMTQHGFARDMEFDCVEQKDDRILFALASNEETFKKYPFNFKLEIEYILNKNNIEVIWRVYNENDKVMPFSIGGHPAFNCPINGIGKQSDYYVLTDAKDSFTFGEIDMNTGLIVKGITHEQPLLEDGSFRLTEDTFNNDALVVEKQIKKLSLLTPEKKAYVTISFDMPACGIWSPTRKNAPFVCLEPWCGRCDSDVFEGTLYDREYSNNIAAGSVFEKRYSITIDDIN